MLSDYLWTLRAKIGNKLIQVPSVAAVIQNVNDQILLPYPKQVLFGHCRTNPPA
jgi:hypothetical protein